MWDLIFEYRMQRIKKRGERMKKEKKLKDLYAKYAPDKKLKTSKIMLGIIVISIIAYVVAAFFLQWHTGVEMSPTITTCWFAFWGTEIIALTGIKISKVFRESPDVYIDDAGSLDENINE